MSKYLKKAMDFFHTSVSIEIPEIKKKGWFSFSSSSLPKSLTRKELLAKEKREGVSKHHLKQAEKHNEENRKLFNALRNNLE